MPDPTLECLTLVDEMGDELCGVYLAAGHLREVGAVLSQSLGHQLFQIVDFPDGDDGVGAVVRADDEGLVFVIADDADPHGSTESRQVVFELAAELGVRDVVYASGEGLAVLDGEPPSHRT
jgi:hypothetical protein